MDKLLVQGDLVGHSSALLFLMLDFIKKSLNREIIETAFIKIKKIKKEQINQGDQDVCS